MSRAPEWKVRRGDCLHRLAELEAQSIDAVVCDPPYGISFNGEDWDGPAIRRTATRRAGRRLTSGEAFRAWTAAWAGECKRVMRPGSHLAAFGAPRTFHQLASGIEDAGLELRDVLVWLYGTGMPKSRRLPGGKGTSLKPSWEPIVLARKPLDGTTTQNLARHRTGALDIDRCRSSTGRHPANVLWTHHARCTPRRCDPGCPAPQIDATARSRQRPSRLFYCAKPDRVERDAGCDRLPLQRLDLFPNARGPASPARNAHPTLKPLAVMRWLVRLTTPSGGTVLDPFCGSGTTGAAAVLEQRSFLGIEQDPGHARVARARIRHWAKTTTADGGR